MNNITFLTNKANINDLESLTLFSDAFGLSTIEAEGYFNTLLKDSLALNLLLDDKKICQLFLIESEMILESAYHIYYLYGACTDQKFRGKGYMHKLIEYAKVEAIKNGKRGIVLRPANSGLFKFYASCGFNKVLYCDSYEHTKTDDCGAVMALSAKEYIAIREKLLKNTPHIALNDNFALGLEYHYHIFGNENSICLAEKYTNNATALIAEHLGDNSSLNYALNELSCAAANVKTVGDSEAFSMLWSNEKEPQYNIYHGPCFE